MAGAIERPLFEGEHVRLTAVDPEVDAATLAAWSHNSELVRAVDPGSLRPQTAAQVKERLTAEDGPRYEFLVRTREDERAIGFARLERIEPIHGTASLSLGIADPADRRQGYGSEALALMADYAFGELNLHRLGAVVPGDNENALAFLARLGFRVEVRRREAIHRDGRRFDLLHLGILAREWGEREGGR